MRSVAACGRAVSGFVVRLWRRRWFRATRAVAVVVAGAVFIAAGWFYSSVELPEDPLVPQASALYYADGQTVLARVGVDNRTDVRIEQVPMPVRHAVLAAEDRTFYSHYGVAPRGMMRAGWAAASGGTLQGASTISQQYVRNAFLTQDRTAERKAKEVVLALKVERRYSKDELLRRYLNTIYFGRGAYGIEAAAQAYFGVSTERLSVEQGAVLAAVIKDPWNFDPAVDPHAAQNRWKWILGAMADAGWARADQVQAARYPSVLPPGSPAGSGPVGLVVDQVERELAKRGVPPQVLRTGGLKVVTTIDAQAQTAADNAVAATLAGQPAELQTALVAVEPSTGAVRAYYGGKRGRGFFDDAAAPRPPASTFKPIVLAEGLRQGIAYRSKWNGTSPMIFPGRNGVPLHNHADIQCPSCTLEESMVESLNTPFYALAEKVGAAKVAELARDLGVPPDYAGQPTLVDATGEPTPGRTRPDVAIGRYPVAPVDLATVYATFAAGGVRTDRHMVTSVSGLDGRRWYTASPTSRRVLPAEVVADVTTVLASVVAKTAPLPARAAAGKTGSQQWQNTDDSQDAWMAGYTAELAAVVWIGRASPGPIRDAAGNAINGDTLPAALWRRFLNDALTGRRATPLPRPAGVGSADLGNAPREPANEEADDKPGTDAPSDRRTGKPSVPPPVKASPSAPGKPDRGKGN